MFTKTVWIFAVTAVLIAGGIYYYQEHTSLATIVEQQMKNEAVDYSIGIKYPFFSGVRHELELNNTVWTFLKIKADVFKAMVRKRNPSGSPVLHKSGFYVEYFPVVFNPQFAAIRFKISTYITSDAHPSTTIEMFNYDLENNSMIPGQTTGLQ